jgi:hypothetical protein
VRTAHWVGVLLGYNARDEGIGENSTMGGGFTRVQREGRGDCNYGGISGYYGGESAQVATNTRCSENPITKEKPECCSH